MYKNRRNQKMSDSIASQHERSRANTFAWGKAISLFLSIPGLRAFWPMSSYNDSGNALDLSGQARTLTLVGNTVYGADGLAPYVEFDGTGDWLIRSDEAGLDIIGNEAFVKAGYKGLTVGGWFYLDRLTSREGLINKGTTTPATTAFLLEHRGDVANDPLRFSVSDGAALVTVDSGATALGAWHFVVGRYLPSTSISVLHNGVVSTETVGVPATLVNTANSLYIGSTSGTYELDGKASLCFLAGAYVPATTLQALYQHTRKLFGR